MKLNSFSNVGLAYFNAVFMLEFKAYKAGHITLDDFHSRVLSFYNRVI